MRPALPPRVFQRRGRRALRRMNERQRAIFWAMRFETTNFDELARRHDITADTVEAEFAQALRILVRTLHEPWWRRLWPW